MQRSVSSSSAPIRTPAQPFEGTTSAPVSHAVAQGMSWHTTQACTAGSSSGVPAANPADGGALRIAWTGHTPTQSPQRVQSARNSGSGRAPGGRK